mmetsp:Transcript_19989/g.33836  ORF Transcript_19989/g.33836 Transcript_19989/m.33836 type:complete len:95 (+) Transcript_19989:279-563(+)
MMSSGGRYSKMFTSSSVPSLSIVLAILLSSAAASLLPPSSCFVGRVILLDGYDVVVVRAGRIRGCSQASPCQRKRQKALPVIAVCLKYGYICRF